MIRCDVCGSPVDLQADDTLLTTSLKDANVDGENVNPEAVEEAIVSALEEHGTPEDYLIMQSLKEDGKLQSHDECIEGTLFAEMFVDES